MIYLSPYYQGTNVYNNKKKNNFKKDEEKNFKKQKNKTKPK